MEKRKKLYSAVVIVDSGFLVIVVLCGVFSRLCCLWHRMWWSATSKGVVNSTFGGRGGGR
jgi:hypothetical protein